ncbi:MAG TPA: nitrilase-related carbon-nitrogen hydrolase [Streptosporangiaceae bacterium]|nr:nitrilase-related carbon-nitrogen hydrolase [Streptosporangiaceae bacterium]
MKPETKDLRWLWLLIGFVLLPFTAYRNVIPLAAWAAPVFLLRFVRVSPRARSALRMVAVAYAVAALIALRGVPESGAALAFTLTAFPLAQGILYMLPYLADRLIGPRLSTWPRMLIFPMAFTSLTWVMSLLRITGTFGTPAYSQYGDLPLVQIVSVTGMWGLTFLIMWFASAVNAAWEHGFAKRATWLPLGAFAAVLIAVFGFGIVRLNASPPTSPKVEAATITISSSVANQAMQGFDWTTFNRSTNAQRAAIRPRFNATVDQMLGRTQTAFHRGAKLVVWQEQSALVLSEDRQAAINRAAALARLNGGYLEIWLGVYTRTQSLPYFRNQAILISPAGTVIWTYNKTHPVFPGESSVEITGPGVLPVASTPYGRLTTAICNDVGYPELLRQAGRDGAGILLVPTHEMYSFWASADAAEAAYRSIENGTSLVRPTGNGISLITDYQGRVIASQDYFHSSGGIMLAAVPTRRTWTLYSRIGDVFAYLCALGLIVLAGWAFAHRTHPLTAGRPQTA